MNLPPELKRIQEEIEGYARDYGLDFCETIFEILDFKQLNEVASFMGFPNRFPHWRFGMEYERLSKSYAYGLHKIYEMVINNDPCYAYLLQCNNYVDQKIVMAHVYGHGDFFKNNFWFSKTNRKMMDEMANHATKVRKYIDKYGYNEVEEFIDICLSIDDLIDRHALGAPAQNVLGLFLTGQPAAVAHGSRGIAGQRADELRGVFAPLGQAAIPLPRQGDCLLDGLLFMVRAVQVAEVNAGVRFDARQYGQEMGV